jgi:two-component system response regulator AtoC
MSNSFSSSSQTVSPHDPHAQPATVNHEEIPAFICVGTTLRRLLAQAEITAPRLRFATIEGDAGTGKHLFAQTMHRYSGHPDLPFRRRDAREWLANEADPSALTGTLLLDRADLLPALGQNLLLKLLKTLQNDTANTSRFLLLVSAHTSLRQLAGRNQFLPDLAFRLSAARFTIPPLREHREDIAPLAQALIDRICRHYQQPTAVLGPGALPRLLQHSWPGNVRELASVLESAILESPNGAIRPSDLAIHAAADPVSPSAPTTPAPPKPETAADPTPDLTLDAAILRHIQMVLELNHGNKLRAARQLDISRSTLYRLLSGESQPPVS